MTALHPFDPATMPLDGIRLVEASAGTGKTHNLAGLYLRLIVEQGLDVREILVMTFTRAASQELRERLRERLAHAAAVAAAPVASPTGNATIFAEAIISGAGDRAAIAERLRDAASRIDQATITTIHGFAQRAAGENAFESALPFDRGDEVDDRELHLEAATDYWRERVFGVSAQQAGAFLELWPTPEALHQAIDPILGKPHAHVRHPDGDALATEHRDALGRWPADRDAFIQLLERAQTEDAARKNEPLAAWLADPGPTGLAERIDQGLTGTADGFPALPAIVEALGTAEGVHGEVKKKATGWFCPQDLASLPRLAWLAAHTRAAAAASAAEAVRQRAGELKRQRRLYSFQDMIAGLDNALADPDSAPALAAALRRTWPWALVDEFQDTDPVQYAILQRLYGTPNTEAGGLILIGDPKQAIYGFRGGDVFAYLDAAGDADAVYGMDTNFRSAPAVLDGLDAIFTSHDAPFVLDGIAYRAVRPGRARDAPALRAHGQPQDGLTAWQVPEALGTSKQAVQPALATATVARIAELLRPGAAAFAGADGSEHPVTPADIAVLVNTNREAAGIQSALNAAGIPAACIQPNSVFEQPAARELLWLMQAVALPYDRTAIRRALVTPFFGYRLGKLIALDREQWQALTDSFQRAHRRWARHGIQAMVDPFLKAAAERVMTRPDGERRLTDQLHVVERLQAAEHEVFGMDGLIRWLETARSQAGQGEVSDADRLRLANDGELVQVTTVHKAKGLQFPVVFVPYAPWLGTRVDPAVPPLSCHDANNRAVIDLAGDETHRVRARQEHRGEQVRSLYVALTRAQQACFFAWGALNGAADGPLGWLLHRSDGADTATWYGNRSVPNWLDAARVEARLSEAANHSGGGLRVESLPQPDTVARPAPEPAPGPLGHARSDLPAPRAPWAVFSFSGLAGQLDAGAEPVAGADDVDEPASDAPATLPPTPEVAMEPRGPAFGQAVHDLLETEPFRDWPTPDQPPGRERRERVATALRRHGMDTTGDPAIVTTTARVIGNTLHTPLPDIGPLSELSPQQSVPEMAFFLRLGGGTGEQVMNTLRQAGYGPRGGIEATALRGLMQGFIDLVVEADGRYWVIDYKTNALGPQYADYAPAKLVTAIRHHHYDLQYLIYTVALHRYLCQRLPGYSPDRHLGGVQYLFVRALQPTDAATGIHIDRPDSGLIKALDALFDGQEASV